MGFLDIALFVLVILLACVKLSVVYFILVAGALLHWVAAVVIFLFENWVFQAIFGAWVVFALQQVHQASVQKSERFLRRYDQKLATTQAFFGLIDKRIYASRIYLSSLLSDGADGSWGTERERYRETVREWNELAPGLVVTMLTLLPARLCFLMERETFSKFSLMDSYLGRVRRSRETRQSGGESVEQIRSLLAEISEFSSVALAEFLNIAREEQKMIDKNPKISPENEPYLSHRYLVASLFKPAVN